MCGILKTAAEPPEKNLSEKMLFTNRVRELRYRARGYYFRIHNLQEQSRLYPRSP